MPPGSINGEVNVGSSQRTRVQGAHGEVSTAE